LYTFYFSKFPLAETRRKKIHPCVRTYLMYQGINKERAHFVNLLG
jgi:hypothetical protein